MQVQDLTFKISKFIHIQIDKAAQNTPILNIMKPIITRAVDNNINRMSEKLGLLADSTGEIAVNNIVSEMIEGIKTSNPFSMNSPIGDITIGDGCIRFTIPYTNKELLLDSQDLDYFKELLTT